MLKVPFAAAVRQWSGSLRAGHCHCIRVCIRNMAANGNASSTHRPRGAFILFEGGDRCGKTTQSENLVKHLSSRGVSTVSDVHKLAQN